ncbi:MAG: hypothetical protein R3C05_27405 [Pirellulaceae bacterium]
MTAIPFGVVQRWFRFGFARVLLESLPPGPERFQPNIEVEMPLVVPESRSASGLACDAGVIDCELVTLASQYCNNVT